MIQNEREIRHELVLQAARRMMTAARTAPKGKGIDIIEIAMVTDGDILRLSDEMIRIAITSGPSPVGQRFICLFTNARSGRISTGYSNKSN